MDPARERRAGPGGLSAAIAEADTRLAQWPPAGAVAQDLADFYPALAEAGLDYGPAFRGVRAAWRRDEEIFAEVALSGAALSGETLSGDAYPR